jgi:hypothetical protein
MVNEIIAMVINTIRLRQDDVSRFYHERILEFRLRILDLRYSIYFIKG